VQSIKNAEMSSIDSSEFPIFEVTDNAQQPITQPELPQQDEKKE